MLYDMLLVFTLIVTRLVLPIAVTLFLGAALERRLQREESPTV